MRYLHPLIVIFASVVAPTPALTQTWLCEEEASVGYANDRGLVLQELSKSQWIFREKVRFDEFFRDYDRFIFKEILRESGRLPASIHRFGDNLKQLCKETRWSNEGEDSHYFVCDNIYGLGRMKFDVKTRKFTRSSEGYEEDGFGMSLLAVGKCTAID